MSGQINLVVGLGNPGKQYQATRHNAGAWFLEALADRYHLSFQHEAKLAAQIAQTDIGNRTIRFVIPTTYMNESGQAVRKVASYYKILPEQILIAHDELDLPAGVIRLKTDGGLSGHNGLKDINNHLHTKKFHRLRIGIDRPNHSGQVHDYVLNKPSAAERQKIDQALDEACSVFDEILQLENWANLMTRLHSFQAEQ